MKCLRCLKIGLLMLITGVFLLSACQLPFFPLGNSSTAGPQTGAATPMGIENSISASPTVETSPAATAGSSYPQAEDTLESPAQGFELATSPSQTPTPTQTQTPLVTTGSDDAYPAVDSPGEYPGPGANPTVTKYPTNPPNSEQPVNPGSETQAALPTQTLTIPSATMTLMPGQATITLGPTLTPLPTASPMSTPTPRPTQTPIPPPPWIQSSLVASNPEEVVLASGKVQLIEFFAFWCGPCQAMAPLVHGLDERYKEQVNFVYLDIDDPLTADLKKQLGYKSQPHFFLLNQYGVVIQQWVGAVPVEVLNNAIADALK
jgi:thiol-disulfide isomerase/thioredoxin